MSEQNAWVVATKATETVSAEVDIALLWNDPDEVVAPSWHGLVQEVHVEPGGRLVSGDVFAVIDGVSRLAWSSPAPFWRSLTVGDSGADVSWLKSLLAARGHSQSTGDVFDWAALIGTRALASDLGVREAATVNGFDLSWIAYLPVDEFDVTSVDLRVAHPAPSPGTVILGGERHLAAAALVSSGSVTGSGQRGGLDTPLPTAQFLELLDMQGITASAVDRLVWAGEVLELDDDGHSVTPESVKWLEKAVASATPALAAVLVREPRSDQLVIPAAAIAHSPTPTVCVGPSGAPREVTVSLEGAGSGGTIVTSAVLDVGDTVRLPAPSGGAPCRSTSSQ